MVAELALAGQVGNNWLERRDPRWRLVSALAFALVTIALTRLDACLWELTLALGLALTSGIAPRTVATRLLAVEGFVVLLLASLPFTVSGPALFTIGSWPASTTGLTLAARLAMQINAILIVMLVLVGSLDPATTARTLGRLGLPDKLVQLLLLTLRQIDILSEEYQRLRRAMRARGFSPRANRHSWRCLGWLLGMLLVRALHRSQRLTWAMRCRGFDGRLYVLKQQPWRASDTVATVLLLPLLFSPIVFEHWASI